MVMAFSHFLAKVCKYEWLWNCVTEGLAQNGSILFLTIYWVVFQRQQTKTASSVARACAEERTLTSGSTWNQSFATLVDLKDRDITETWTTELFQKWKVCCEKDPVLKPLTRSYHKWPSFKALQSKLAPPVLLHTSLFPLTPTLNLCLLKPLTKSHWAVGF